MVAYLQPCSVVDESVNNTARVYFTFARLTIVSSSGPLNTFAHPTSAARH